MPMSLLQIHDFLRPWLSEVVRAASSLPTPGMNSKLDGEERVHQLGYTKLAI